MEYLFPKYRYNSKKELDHRNNNIVVSLLPHQNYTVHKFCKHSFITF